MRKSASAQEAGEPWPWKMRCSGKLGKHDPHGGRDGCSTGFLPGRCGQKAILKPLVLAGIQNLKTPEVSREHARGKEPG